MRTSPKDTAEAAKARSNRIARNIVQRELDDPRSDLSSRRVRSAVVHLGLTPRRLDRMIERQTTRTSP